MPDAGGTFFLPRLIGPQRAMALAVTGDRIDAETAAAWGMIYKCVDDDALIDEVTAFAAASGDPADAHHRHHQAADEGVGYQ